MTHHVDFTLASGGQASVQFTSAPIPLRVTIGLASGADLVTFTPQDAAGARALPAGALRVSAFYEANGTWVPIDVDLNEDTARRAIFRCSAYVGGSVSSGAGTTKLEALVTVTRG